VLVSFEASGSNVGDYRLDEGLHTPVGWPLSFALTLPIWRSPVGPRAAVVAGGRCRTPPASARSLLAHQVSLLTGLRWRVAQVLAALALGL
jgi:hypothetical protein